MSASVVNIMDVDSHDSLNSGVFDSAHISPSTCAHIAIKFALVATANISGSIIDGSKKNKRIILLAHVVIARSDSPSTMKHRVARINVSAKSPMFLCLSNFVAGSGHNFGLNHSDVATKVSPKIVRALPLHYFVVNLKDLYTSSAVVCTRRNNQILYDSL